MTDRTERDFNPDRLGMEATASEIGPLSVLRLNGMAEQDRLERIGLDHFKREHLRCRGGIPALSTDLRFTSWSPPGPQFEYERNRVLFSGRHGIGPLWVALDTNQVIDYYNHGGEMWRGVRHSAISDAEHLGELHSFSLLLALLVVRDLRFMVLAESLRDARKAVSSERQRSSEIAFEHFARAMSHFADVDEDLQESRKQTLRLPDPMLEEALGHVPGALDRMMVRAAVRAGAHVFMTRDRRVLTRENSFGHSVCTSRVRVRC